MAFLFPDVYSAVDWEKGYDFLDKELQQAIGEAEVGKLNFADESQRVRFSLLRDSRKLDYK